MSELHITVWYVTPVRDATHKLDGPFETYSEAQKRCVQLASEETRQRIINEVLAGKPISQIAMLYMPAPSRLTHIPGPVKYRVLRTENKPLILASPVTLLGKLKLLSRGKLMKIAAAISMPVPPELYHNRAALAAHVHAALHRAANADAD